MYRTLLSFVLACAVWGISSSASSGGLVSRPTGLSPGDQYRLVFVTSTSRDATATDIEAYNAFVTNTANSVPERAALGTTEKAIATTGSTSARDNTDTKPLNATALPVYQLADALVANSNADLWDGTLLAPINSTEQGTLFSNLVDLVWTGTNIWMHPAFYDGFLGAALPTLVMFGSAHSTQIYWMTADLYDSDGSFLHYAISRIRIVPDPTTILLATVGILGLPMGLRRRRRGYSEQLGRARCQTIQCRAYRKLFFCADATFQQCNVPGEMLMNRFARTVRSPVVLTIGCLLIGLAVGSMSNRARAGTYTLASNNSSIHIDTTAQATIDQWIVEGVPHLEELSNWLRLSSPFLPVTGEASLHSLNITYEVPSDSDGDQVLDTLDVTYDLPNQFSIDIRYSVQGGAPGSGFSSMGERVRIHNHSILPVTFHFYEYVDLDLHGTPLDDTAQFIGPNIFQQTDPQTIVGGSFINASRYEIDTYPNTLNRLLDNSPTTLSNSPGFGVPMSGNVTMALEWDFQIAKNATFEINKEWQLQMISVPEPSSVVLALASVLTLIGGIRGRRKTAR